MVSITCLIVIWAPFTNKEKTPLPVLLGKNFLCGTHLLHHHHHRWTSIMLNYLQTHTTATTNSIFFFFINFSPFLLFKASLQAIVFKPCMMLWWRMHQYDYLIMLSHLQCYTLISMRIKIQLFLEKACNIIWTGTTLWQHSTSNDTIIKM